MRKLSELIPEIRPTEYTNIWRRGTQLHLNLPYTISVGNEPVVIAVDSTGITATNRGEWMREKWKIHLAVDVTTKEMVAIEVTDVRVSDSSRFNSHTDQTEENLSGRKIEKVLGDVAFDRREIFDHLQQTGIQPVIKTRSNARIPNVCKAFGVEYVGTFQMMRALRVTF